MEKVVFDDWTIVDTISHGKFSTVYKARKNDGSISSIKYISLPLDKQANDKIIKLGYVKDYNDANNYFVKVINSEVEIMKKFNGNPYIVNCYNTYAERTSRGMDYYVMMEYVEDLKSYYGKKKIELKDVIKIGRDICSALSLCSFINLIHGDIKPENVFVGLDGNYKLGDFSASFNVDNSQSNDSGTLNYMSPEKYNGKTIDFSSDVYSLGIMMYQLISGKLPFVSSSVDEKKAFELRMSGKDIPLIKGINKNIMDIILKACSFNPDNRYKNAMEMKKDLDNIQTVNSKQVSVTFSNNKTYEDTIDINDVELLKKYSSNNSKKKHVSHFVDKHRFKVVFLVVFFVLLISALGTTYAFNRSCPPGHVNNNGFCVDGYYYCDDGYTLNQDNKCQKTLKSTDAKISYTCPNGYTMTDEEHCVSEEQKEMTKSYECIIDGTTLNKKTNKCEQLVDAQPIVTCPDGYVVAGSECVTMSSVDATSSYGCNDSSYTLYGNQCRKTIVKEVNAEQKFVCDTGGTLKGNVCDYVLKPSYSWYRPSCTRGQYNASDQMCHYTESPKYSYVCGTNGVYIGNGKCRQEVNDSQNAVIKYSCPSGYVVNGTKCFKSANVNGTIKYSCADNMQLRGNKCVVTTDSVEVMKCPDGYVTTGISCVEENIPMPVKKYSCSRAYSLNGDKCEKYDIIKAKKVLSDKEN